jgi:hypothetical protein
MSTTAKPRIPAIRLAADNETVLQQLGLLADLAGTWAGTGFNLIARPDFHDGANLYLQLNQTHETLTIEPIGSPIPNRGFGQDDIELFGLNYLQKISDLPTGGALHIEPGLWITQPPTSYPPETTEPGDQMVFRMGTIPHGNALLAEGTATAFSGAPTLADGKVPYAFSTFPSFNSTPFPAGGPINAAGSSEQDTAPPGKAFTQYAIANAASLANPRTPFDTDPPEPPLPADINGVAMQTVVNDPITLLQQEIKQQVAAGDTFTGVALNIATQQQIKFLNQPNDHNPNDTSTIDVVDGGGGVENIPFLDGGIPTGAQGPNAQTALVYATFWIEHVTPRNRAPFMQLQYAQFTVLDFPIFTVLHPAPGAGTPALINLGWPHISVATLRKTFN